jgi:hypothetical protein
VSLSKGKEAQKGSALISLLRMEHNWNFLTVGRKLETFNKRFDGVFSSQRVMLQII